MLIYFQKATFLDAVSASAFILVTKSFSSKLFSSRFKSHFRNYYSRLSRFPHPMFDKALCYSLQSAFKGVFIGHYTFKLLILMDLSIYSSSRIPHAVGVSTHILSVVEGFKRPRYFPKVYSFGFGSFSKSECTRSYHPLSYFYLLI